jgi:hypothetical protein
MAKVKKVPHGEDHRKYTSQQSGTADPSGGKPSGRNNSRSRKRKALHNEAEVNPDESQNVNISHENAVRSHPREDVTPHLDDKIEILTDDRNQVPNVDKDLDGSHKSDADNVDGSQLGRTQRTTLT